MRGPIFVRQSPSKNTVKVLKKRRERCNHQSGSGFKRLCAGGSTFPCESESKSDMGESAEVEDVRSVSKWTENQHVWC